MLLTMLILYCSMLVVCYATDSVLYYSMPVICYATDSVLCCSMLCCYPVMCYECTVPLIMYYTVLY